VSVDKVSLADILCTTMAFNRSNLLELSPLFGAILLLSTASIAQVAGGVQAEPRFHTIRSVSGSKGTEQAGRYVMEDPRTVFYTPQDKQVIVYFEWQGPIGAHHLEGYWKNPEGKSVIYSDFNFDSKQPRFGAYWILTLSEGIKPGKWSLEAHVDGEMTGTHAFEIAAGSNPGPAVPARRLFPPSDIYKLASGATVAVEKLSTSGQKIFTASGFVVSEGLVVTSFAAIDGASDLGIVFADGKRNETKEVVDFDRWQDWAIVKVPTSSVQQSLVRAQPNSWAVGDRCYFLDVTKDGSRIIADTNVVGISNDQNAGQRLALATTGRGAASGSPVLNEYGEVLAILGGSTIPGADSLVNSRAGYFYGGLRLQDDPAARATPINLVREPKADQPPRTLEWMAQSGQFVMPVEADEQLVNQASLALNVDNRPGLSPMAINEKYEFNKHDGHFVIFVMWAPRTKHSGLVAVRIYTLANRALIASKPAKVNLKANGIMYSSWQIGLEPFQAGIYRVDLTLEDKPIWRSFFRVSD